MSRGTFLAQRRRLRGSHEPMRFVLRKDGHMSTSSKGVQQVNRGGLIARTILDADINAGHDAITFSN